MSVWGHPGRIVSPHPPVAAPWAARAPRLLRTIWWVVFHISDALDGSGVRALGQSEPRAIGSVRGARASAGADADFEAFIREHQRAILNYLWRMTGDEQTAYDLTQEVFVRAWRHFDAVRGYERPRSWLFRVATNLALTGFNARKVLLTSIDALGADKGPAGSDPAWRVVERDLVRAALDGLAPRRRAALTLREVYGCSMAEVAHALGVSEAAARMTLSRARDQFRELYLKERGDEHGA